MSNSSSSLCDLVVLLQNAPVVQLGGGVLVNPKVEFRMQDSVLWDAVEATSLFNGE